MSFVLHLFDIHVKVLGPFVLLQEPVGPKANPICDELIKVNVKKECTADKGVVGECGHYS